MSYIKQLNIGGVNYELKTDVIEDKRSGNNIKFWTGTKSQYNALSNKDANTFYALTDDNKLYLGEEEVGVAGETLHALKSYLDGGEILTDPEGLASVQAYYRSTFDSNKFEVVSPNNTVTITNDGIVSGFSSGSGTDYIRTKFDNSAGIRGILTSFNTFEIHFGRFKFSSFSAHDWMVANDASINASIGGIMIRTDVASGSVVFRLWLGTGSITAWDIASSLPGDVNHINDLNKDIELKLIFDGSQYILYSNVDNAGWVQEGVVPDSTKIANALPFYIAPSSTEHAYTWDAKYFSLKVNNTSEYYNGNISGVDYVPIQGDNYNTIAYNLSKTGSKIVDIYYRNRVIQNYRYNGYSPYYTVSENDFTLPMGEIYGLIQRATCEFSSRVQNITNPSLSLSGDATINLGETNDIVFITPSGNITSMTFTGYDYTNYKANTFELDIYFGANVYTIAWLNNSLGTDIEWEEGTAPIFSANTHTLITLRRMQWDGTFKWLGNVQMQWSTL